ncbi:MAG: hypothetical protein IK096_04160, partial [Lachnospiraceae bacterium]|nr:hypothetical protein [Lachnospiraceae bacterium]
CKAALQEQLGLAREADTPVLAIVSRLVGHKGMDLVCQVADGILASGVLAAVIVIKRRGLRHE